MLAATQDRILGLASGEGEALWLFDGLATLKVSGEQSCGQFSLIEMLYPAGAVVPRHVDHREDELFYLIGGELEMRVGERQISAKPGTTIFSPRNIPHGFQVGTSAPVHSDPVYASGVRGLHQRYEQTRAKTHAAPDPGRTTNSRAATGDWRDDARALWLRVGLMPARTRRSQSHLHPRNKAQLP